MLFLSLPLSPKKASPGSIAAGTCYVSVSAFIRYLPYSDALKGLGRYLTPDTNPIAANIENSDEPP